MSSKRKCIVILLFIVLVTILFILYNRSQFFFGIFYHCTYSVYEVHSKSFKNNSNLRVNRLQNRSIKSDKTIHYRPPLLVNHYDTKLAKHVKPTDTPPRPLPENSLAKQNYLLHLTGLAHPRNVTKYKQCPEGRVLTSLLSGRLGNVIFEYMSMIAVEEMYSDWFNMHTYLPGNMKIVLELLFQRVETPEIVDLPAACISMRHAQVVRGSAKPAYEPGVPYNSPIILDVFACRYDDIVRYGLENFRSKLQFNEHYSHEITKFLLKAKAKFGFNITDNVTYIGVHYRGSNYSAELNKIYPQKFKGPSTFGYYMNAMQYFNKTNDKVIFLLVSEDQLWMEENIPYLRGFNIVGTKNWFVQDFILLALCNHSIINYGTFGTAAAIFAGGTTLVYDVNLPHDGRGYTVAISMASMLSNWYTCSNVKCLTK